MSSNVGKEQKAHPPISLGEIHEIYKLHLEESRFKGQLIAMEKSKVLQERKFYVDKAEVFSAQAEEVAGIADVSAAIELYRSARTNFQKARSCFDKWQELHEVEVARWKINPEIVNMMHDNDT